MIFGGRNDRKYFLFQDLHLVNLDEFKVIGTNITAFRLIDPDSPAVQDVTRLRMSGRDGAAMKEENIKVIYFLRFQF